MRDDHDRFAEFGARILAIAPESVASTNRYLERNPMPFPLLPDPEHQVFDQYDVISTMMSLGQRPALFVLDAAGVVRYNQVGVQQWQIPPNEEILGVLRALA